MGEYRGWGAIGVRMGRCRGWRAPGLWVVKNGDRSPHQPLQGPVPVSPSDHSLCQCPLLRGPGDTGCCPMGKCPKSQGSYP